MYKPAIFLLFTCLSLYSGQLAFPGAEGFGANSRGGRNGKVIFVTSLLDNLKNQPPIPGSLRAAVEAYGPRTIIFKISGNIHLRRPLEIKNPFITIAGQTAPGDGVCLTNYALIVNTHDVIIRYLRVRPGDLIGKILKEEGKNWDTDALSIVGNSKDVIIDHCSLSWGNDEVCSVSGAGITNITVQWCFITESLNDSTHAKGQHGYGSLIRTNGDVSFHHNLYAFHRSRSPRPGTYGEGAILLDFRNNFMYKGGQGYTAKDPSRLNFINNFHIDTPFKATDSCRFFATGNNGSFTGGVKQPKAFEVSAVNTFTALEAKEQIMQSAGASLPVRDSVDKRTADLINAGKGSVINSQKDVGGLPKLEMGKVPDDSDNDGMPDEWEKKFNLNAEKESHNNDADMDGYSDLDEFLNNSNPQVKN